MWLNEVLLDESHIQGARALVRRVSPTRQVLLVRSGDLDDTVGAIEYACQCWGGASTLLIPTGAEGPRDPFATLLRVVPERASRRGLGVEGLPDPLSSVDGYSAVVEPLLSATLGAGANRPSPMPRSPGSSRRSLTGRS
jgi:hypothetical protein